MKIILTLLLLVSFNTVYAVNKYVCSDKLKMDIANSSTNEYGVWIDGAEPRGRLSFDIDGIDRIYLYHVVFKNDESACDWKSVKVLNPKFFLHFEAPFIQHKITVSVPYSIKKHKDTGKKKHYMFVASKVVNGERISYFKNFTFNIR